MSENKMTKEEALAFLRSHQPMPDTDDDEAFNADPEALDLWCEACEFFEKNPCEEAIPLFLNSFGGGDGYEAYYSTEAVINKFPANVFLPYFIEAFQNPKTDKKQLSDLFWTMDYLLEKSDVDEHLPELITCMFGLLRDPSLKDKYFVAASLNKLSERSIIDLNPYKAELLDLDKLETDENVLRELGKILDRLD